MKLKILVITLLIFICLILFSGCVGTETKVLINGYYEASGLALLSNPFNVDLHLEATNVGDIDAKNVEAVVQMTYDGNVVGQDRIYFGTVKVGIPVTKYSILKVTIPDTEWARFDRNKLELDIKSIIIDGKETLRQSY